MATTFEFSIEKLCHNLVSHFGINKTSWHYQYVGVIMLSAQMSNFRNPTKCSADTLMFIQSHTDTFTTSADTDTGILDEELMTLGLKWRWKKSKGLDYAEDFSSYEIRVQKAMQNDGAKMRIDTSNSERDRVPRPPQTPETLIFS